MSIVVRSVDGHKQSVHVAHMDDGFTHVWIDYQGRGHMAQWARLDDEGCKKLARALITTPTETTDPAMEDV